MAAFPAAMAFDTMSIRAELLYLLISHLAVIQLLFTSSGRRRSGEWLKINTAGLL